MWGFWLLLALRFVFIAALPLAGEGVDAYAA